MKTPTLRSIRSARWILTLGLLMVAASALAEDGLVCGRPPEFGYIQIKISVKKGTVTRTILVPVYVYGGIEPYEKADLIRRELNSGARAETLSATGTGATVWVAGDDGWSVLGVTVGDDETKEPEKLLSAAPPPDQQALCSVSGVASGVGAGGAPSYLMVAVSGQMVRVPTSQGMTASAVEQQIISLLHARGVQARFATGSDFADGFEDLVNDGSVVWMQPADTSGFSEQLTDTGLMLELAALLDTRRGAAAVEEALLDTPIEFAASPGRVSGEPIHLRYSIGDRRGPVDVCVYDVVGRRVRLLLEGVTGRSGTFTWDGLDDRRSPVPSGVYFLRLSLPGGSAVRKVVRLRD